MSEETQVDNINWQTRGPARPRMRRLTLRLMPRCVVCIRRCVYVQIFQLTVVSHRLRRAQLRSAQASCVSENSAAPDVVTRHITTRGPALAEGCTHGRKYLRFPPDKERHSVVFESWFKSCAVDLRRLHHQQRADARSGCRGGASAKTNQIWIRGLCGRWWQ